MNITQTMQTQAATLNQSAHRKQHSAQSNFATVLSVAHADSESNEGKAATSSNSYYTMMTNEGKTALNLDNHFKAAANVPGSTALTKAVLILPTKQNVDNLSAYSEMKVKALLAEHDIPFPPKSITFDDEGKLVLPKDYKYKDELIAAFEAKPEVLNAVRATIGIASQYQGLMESQPFRDEMAMAKDEQARKAILKKYSYLFDENRPHPQTILSFLEDGRMSVVSG
ncbi:hypothetical protein EAG18_14685 [Pseudoalteromonas sp. J010]|uniref:hypothetical protein n=1 Tax=Pseudoalteromonas sp. J010 TaxID=998465 RepID=UPI000F652F61|nr:hypothetical protein [Pseudoalteromonas sp. J010]RRS07928.1 hypothetical protein EAG18_14685 [Pseudoalteromonas sp. J010]